MELEDEEDDGGGWELEESVDDQELLDDVVGDGVVVDGWSWVVVVVGVGGGVLVVVGVLGEGLGVSPTKSH
jgi:hypothetical protein